MAREREAELCERDGYRGCVLRNTASNIHQHHQTVFLPIYLSSHSVYLLRTVTLRRKFNGIFI